MHVNLSDANLWLVHIMAVKIILWYDSVTEKVVCTNTMYDLTR